MAVNINDVLSAYKSAARTDIGKKEPEKSEAGENFANMVKGVMNEAVDAGKEAERMSMKAVAGEGDIREVVNAVTNAEMALETVVAVRDKVISAYQDIIKMPI